jgi:hypothetical protein
MTYRIPPSPFLRYKDLAYQGKGGFTGTKKDKIGRTMCYAEGKRKPCPKPEKPARPKRPTVDEAAGKLRDALAHEVSADTVRGAVSLLMGLTVADLVALKKKLGLKASGAKAELARKVAERALRKGPEKKPPEPEDKKPPEPEEEKPEKVEPKKEEKPPATTAPEPPEPGFTGLDTLGRRWLNGKLQPGEPEPPRPPEPLTITYDPKRRLRLADLTGGKPVPKITDELRRDLETLRMAPPWNRTMDLNDYDVSQHPEEVYRLAQAGILEPFYDLGPRMYQNGRAVGAHRMTDAGAVAIARAWGGGEELPDPSTKKAIGTYGRLFRGLTKAGKGRLLEHLGVPEAERKKLADSSYDFQRQLEKMAYRVHNPTPMAERIRKAGDLHGTVTSLSRISMEDPEVERLRGEMDRLDEYSKREFSGYSILSLPYWIESRRRELENPKVRNKIKLRNEMERMQKTLAEWEKLRDEKVKRRDASRNFHYEAVSEQLRSRTKDPGLVVVSHSPDVPEGPQKRMNAAADLLFGVVQRYGPGRELPEFRTYKDGTNERAHNSNNRINFWSEGYHSSEPVAIHEIMHGIESGDPSISQAVQEFRDYRVRPGEPAINLKRAFGGSFEGDEVGYKDEFDRGIKEPSSAAYVGKTYGSNATEILTMGVEHLYRNPRQFCAGDPEYAAFVIGILDGSLRSNPIPEE